jgi:hypothetical protein
MKPIEHTKLGIYILFILYDSCSEILLKVALNTINQSTSCSESAYCDYVFLFYFPIKELNNQYQ